MRRLVTAALAAALAPGAATAELLAVQRVEMEIVVKDAEGEERVERVKAERVKPGEQVIYALAYSSTAEAAENVVLVMPVPPEVTYVEGSVLGQGASVTFSADGGATFVARGRLTVTEDGAERAASNGDITHIKWTLSAPVAANAAGEVSFRGVLK